MKHNWEYKRIDDLGIIKSGYTPSSDELASHGDFPYFKVAEMNLPGNEKYLMYSPSYLSGEIKTFPAHSIVFPKNGAAVSTNKKRILQVDSVVDLNTAVMIANQNISVNYLYYILINIDFANLVKRGAVPTLNISELKSTIVPVPPMEVQQQIVAELDKINEVIADCRELLRNLDALAQSLFYDYFGDPVTNTKGWTLKTLGTISTVFGGSTPKTNIAEYWNGELCWITPAELKGEKYISNTERHISELGRASARLLLFPKNTVLLTSRAPIGKVAIAKTPMYCNQGFKNLICDEQQVHFQYVYFFLSLITDVLNEKGSGATFKEISKRVTESISIPVPPLELQKKFAERIEQIDAQKKAVEETITNLQTLLDSRMDYWFN